MFSLTDKKIFENQKKQKIILKANWNENLQKFRNFHKI